MLNVIQKNYDKNLEILEVIDALMIDGCAEEGVSFQQKFFYFAFSLLLFLFVFIIVDILEKNLNNSVEDIKNSLWKLYGLHKKEEIFSGDHACV